MTTRQRVADLEQAVYRLTGALGRTTEMLAELAAAEGPEGRDLVRAQALEALREMTVVLEEIRDFFGPKVGATVSPD
jgi:hypothetical protein